MTDEQKVSNPRLIVEGGIKVLYKGVWVTEIPFDRDEITIGVMDPENDIYPDINLRQYRLDGGDPYISRRHATLRKKEGKYYIEDTCKNNSTSTETKSNIINGEEWELKEDARIFISESVTFIFKIKADEEKVEQPEEESKESKEKAEPESEEKVEVESEEKAEPESEEKAEPESEEKAEPESEEKADVESEEKVEVEPEKQELTDNVDDKTVEIEEPESEVLDETKENKGTPSFYLEVEGQVHLFFKPRNIFTHIIELHPAEWDVDSVDNKKSLQIGRRSTEDGVYPDIDLWKFYFNDGDEYIARRHARIIEEEGKFYFQDISGKGSTWFNEKDDEHRLVRTDTDEAKVEIQAGDKLIISDSATFIVHKQ